MWVPQIQATQGSRWAPLKAANWPSNIWETVDEALQGAGVWAGQFILLSEKWSECLPLRNPLPGIVHTRERGTCLVSREVSLCPLEPCYW